MKNKPHQGILKKISKSKQENQKSISHHLYQRSQAYTICSQKRRINDF